MRRPARVLLATGLVSVITLLALDLAFPLPRAALARPDGGLVVTAEDGTPLRTYPSADGVWRYPVAADQVSPLYYDALLTFEDRWFYWHPGVNPVAMARAAWQWARSGRVVSGGSTLTMQVARMVDPRLHYGDRSLRGKLRQVLRALQLEWHLSKAQILALYLNHAPMGGIVEGVEMASRAYLGKPSSQLSHAEAALLTALPQAPSRLRPDRAPAAAQAARDKVLDRLRDLGTWDAATVADARIEQVIVQPLRARWLAPLAAERLRQGTRVLARESSAKTGSRPPGGSGTGQGPNPAADIASGASRGSASAPSAAVPPGLPLRAASLPTTARTVVRSTLDIELQSAVETMLLDRVDALPPKVSMAVLVMDNDTLATKVYAGSADFSDRRRANHVDMVRGVRSPGSTLKPFLYAMALDDGLIHSESLLVDAPQSFGGYRPGNFQAAFSGPVSVSDALQRSLNVPAVDLLDRVGPARFASNLRAAGLRLRMGTGISPNLSLILGGGGTTLEELVAAYRALARGGMAGQPRLEPDAPRVEARIMSPGAAFIVREILENGGHPDRPFYDGPRGLAWKTGTSFGFRDAWAVGVTDGFTIGVWVGRPDGTPNPGFFGANVAAPLLQDIVAALPAPPPAPRKPPAEVTQVSICWPLGLAASVTSPALCQIRRQAWALDGAVPPTLPDRVAPAGPIETLWISPITGHRTRPTCSVPGEPVQVARWPTYLQPWLESGLLAAYAPPPWDPACRAAGARSGLRIEGVDTGAQLLPVPGGRDITVGVRALGGSGTVWWLLDGQPQQQSPGTAAVTLKLRENGKHAVTAMDEAGRYDSVSFTVRGLPGTAASGK
ncbi:penicillin-binding protein 1C [Pigmentiphaga litoralis]|uniref:penicillin-binding protein 1C n=1 Tax=Pigmentiphaga litoralis TaxID=516702 RepID=UPI00359C91F3